MSISIGVGGFGESDSGHTNKGVLHSRVQIQSDRIYWSGRRIFKRYL